MYRKCRNFTKYTLIIYVGYKKYKIFCRGKNFGEISGFRCSIPNINMHFLKTGMTKSSSSEADCKQTESRKKEEIIKETKNHRFKL